MKKDKIRELYCDVAMRAMYNGTQIFGNQNIICAALMLGEFRIYCFESTIRLAKFIQNYDELAYVETIFEKVYEELGKIIKDCRDIEIGNIFQ